MSLIIPFCQSNDLLLNSHQLQALTFMLQREQGWAWDGSRADIWELYSETTGSQQVLSSTTFTCVISGVLILN